MAGSIPADKTALRWNQDRTDRIVVGSAVLSAPSEAPRPAPKIVPESVVNLPLPKGHYKGAIDLSFVPGNGPWTLKLNDVASGVKAEAKVKK